MASWNQRHAPFHVRLGSMQSALSTMLSVCVGGAGQGSRERPAGDSQSTLAAVGMYPPEAR
jgi:hypothetical protein